MNDEEERYLDLAISLVCSMQLDTATRLCAELAPQVAALAWFELVAAVASCLEGRGAADALAVAEAAVTGRPASTLLAAASGDGQRLRRLGVALSSTARRVTGWAHVDQPVQLHGPGGIVLGESSHLGYARSPGFLSGYGYIDARHPLGRVTIGERTVVNNGCSLVSESEGGIAIGSDCLIGTNVTIYDSDFHGLHPDKRLSGGALAPVVIGDQVWLGDGVLVLKGVTIGVGAVVAARSIVRADVAPGAIVAGVPARVVGDVFG